MLPKQLHNLMVRLWNFIEWNSKVLQDNFGDNGVVFVFDIVGKSVV